MGKKVAEEREWQVNDPSNQKKVRDFIHFASQLEGFSTVLSVISKAHPGRESTGEVEEDKLP